MARKATEEQKAAELKNKVQTVKKSQEGAATQQQQEVQQTVQQFQAGEEARTIAAKRTPQNRKAEKPQLRQTAKEVAEGKATARQQTMQKAGGKTTAEAENVSRQLASGNILQKNIQDFEFLV